MVEPIRVILVDDEVRMIEPFKLMLESAGNYSVSFYDNAMEALRFLKSYTNDLPDIILSDILMPGMDGYQFGVEVRKDHRLCHIPFIYFSAKSDVPYRIKAMSITPHFFPKDGDRKELLSLIQSVLNEHKVQSGMNPLTSLPGNAIIERIVNNVVNTYEHYSIFYIDCDNFKAYNDVYGTYAGDRAIQEIAKALDRAIIRTAGEDFFLGHLGGDDFVSVLWKDINPEDVSNEIFREIKNVCKVIYSEKDLEKGFFEGKNRKGEKEQFDLLSVSIGVIWNSIKSVSSWAEASNFLCEVKRKAKSQKGNSYCIDKRKK
ncbi:MAG: response regulator [Elusimicrobiota bacterium]